MLNLSNIQMNKQISTSGVEKTNFIFIFVCKINEETIDTLFFIYSSVE